jgi:cytochrome d ubiquinol oxidase subunit II
METIWFCLVAFLLAGYVVLDGFDLGCGVAHLLIARTESDRLSVLRAIGPVWDGNEVWLLAAGGTLYFAFPALYADSFSGFYLPLMIVLWLLILRGISIEFRNHLQSLVWQPLWDTVFAFSSGLLAIFFGAALGNVVRGVPLDRAGEFFLPLWTNFAAGPESGILDWYTVLVAVAALLALTLHGALWLALKVPSALEVRARGLAAAVWWPTLAAVIAITLASFRIQPHLRESFAARPWCYVFPFIAITGLVASKLMNTASRALTAFLASCAFLLGMLSSVAAGLFPYVLPSNGDPRLGLTIFNSAAPRYGLEVGLYWFIPGMLLTFAYFTYTYRSFTGKVE